jgi:hypothetical protein
MTIERVQQAAWIRVIYFSGDKKWRNNTVGYAYEVMTPNGFDQSTTVNGIYKAVTVYPVIRNRKGELNYV